VGRTDDEPDDGGEGSGAAVGTAVAGAVAPATRGGAWAGSIAEAEAVGPPGRGPPLLSRGMGGDGVPEINGPTCEPEAVEAEEGEVEERREPPP